MKSLFSALKYIAMLGAGIFLFWLAFRKHDFSQILQEVGNIHYTYILIAFVAGVISHYSRAIRWNLLIKPMGYKTSDFNSFLAVMIGYLANLALPRMGEISRCVVVNRTNKVPVDKLIGTVIVERIIDVLGLFVILLLTLILEFDKLKVFFVDNLGNKLSGSTATLLTTTNIFITVSFLALSIFGVVLIWKKYKEAALILKIRNFLAGFVEGLKSLRHMEKLWLFIFHSVLIWSMYYFQIYICFFALNSTENLSAIAALSVLVMGSFGMVVPVQGGIGAYHAAVSETLKLYGLAATDALTFAFIAHTFQMVVVLILGGLSFLALTFVTRKNKQDEPLTENTIETV
ncbi:MAG: lysylphosphatidylglycerol synthase transmembrane domain-containing protein [Bacteroidia bacterium]